MYSYCVGGIEDSILRTPNPQPTLQLADVKRVRSDFAFAFVYRDGRLVYSFEFQMAALP